MLRVLSQSEAELVVYKPAGLASETRDPRAPSVLSMVANDFPGARLPHRLDAVTRGILLVCLGKEAVAFHNAQIKARRWEKYYLARVGKEPSAFVGEQRAFLKEERGRARVVRSGGDPAWLDLLATAPVPNERDRWHLLIRLRTGRFHQIRVMCAALGLPLVGDPLYDPEARDESAFYLEHALLKYEDFGHRRVTTAFLPELPERGPIADELVDQLRTIAARETLDPFVSGHG